jgi:hypothetical protein
MRIANAVQRIRGREWIIVIIFEALPPVPEGKRFDR